jgi:muconolactone delta-isomerase
MIETTRHDLEAAFYGIVRLVAGYNDWSLVDSKPNEQRIQVLLDKAMADFQKLAMDPLNADPKQQNQAVRKLKAYQQLQLMEKFMFQEVIWD